MRARIFLVTAVFTITIPAKAQDKVELFGGYSYVRGTVAVNPIPTTLPCPPNCSPPPTMKQAENLNGWEFSGRYKLIGPVGLVGDLGGQYGIPFGGGAALFTYLVGPQLSLPERFSPFVHGLVGGAHESMNRAAFQASSSNSVAYAVGGGIDLRLARFVSLRLIQVDYLHTHFLGLSENQPRVSFGVVIRVGGGSKTSSRWNSTLSQLSFQIYCNDWR